MTPVSVADLVPAEERAGPTLIEGIVLGLLIEAPRHGFAVAKELGPDGWIGITYTAHRPVVYRALRTLAGKGLLAQGHTETTSSGPDRVIERANAKGRAEFFRWLGTPVPHMREVRVDLLVKLALHDRLGLDPLPLVRRQYDVLEPIYKSLRDPDELAGGFDRTVALWRAESSDSVMRFLRRLLQAAEPDDGAQ